MPRIISFAWTTPDLLAGRKTCTRRQWSPGWAQGFRRGDPVQAYDRDPRRGGKPIARIRLTHDPAYQADADMPDADYEAEGFAYLDEHPEQIPRAFALAPGETLRDRFAAWRQGGGYWWVIRFERVDCLETSRPPTP